MKEYIEKSAVVAEIERLIKYDEMVMNHDAQITELLSRELNTLYELSSFVKSLEVKEVDLDDKDKWKNTGGFGSTWDPDSPDYCLD